MILGFLQGTDSNSFRFMFDGVRVQKDDTAETVRTAWSCPILRKKEARWTTHTHIYIKSNLAGSANLIVLCIEPFASFFQLGLEDNDEIEVMAEQIGGAQA